ncbi:Prepilin type IV endopeptidase, peptidase domain [Moorella glycerini]|uniref:Type 4 prepilin-like proteins leader peptide-processing enzyme n=1 Tax=Neomoorella stamsii TaxID=1266720 RepID=A0A9X7J673_9FIRM|nr:MULTISPECIES: A24 family peptidase [Moorella]PRR77748.1 Type 4 prepilin-like proteins leader peptide-processing enzyme [Moorella stamsii]CEP66035.1 Prepilin type IV endopeptidase, peptidase domain [Moorella glycerini]
MFQILIGIFGSIIGSFLGLCIARLPKGESIVSPPSHCDACGRRLGAVELIPVAGYLIYRGRCRSCGAPVPWWYTGLELLTAGIYLSLWYRFGPTLVALKYAVLASLLLVIAGIDLRTYMIPDSLVLVGLGCGLLFLPLGEVYWPEALVGAALGGGILFLIAAASRGGMGGGDVKLGLVLGLFLGWQQVLVALFLAILAGALMGVILIALGRKRRRDALPFAPFLTAGTLGALWWGRDIINWYIATFFGL